MLCFMVYNGIFKRVIYYLPLLLQQIVTKHFATFWHLHKAVTYKYANETTSRTGKNSGLTHNYSSGRPQCYDPGQGIVRLINTRYSFYIWNVEHF